MNWRVLLQKHLVPMQVCKRTCVHSEKMFDLCAAMSGHFAKISDFQRQSPKRKSAFFDQISKVLNQELRNSFALSIRQWVRLDTGQSGRGHTLLGPMQWKRLHGLWLKQVT